MNDLDKPAPPGEPPRVRSQPEFAAAVHWAVDTAVQRGARRMTWVDPDFADWPLSAAGLLAQLGPWLRLPGRNLVLLAQSFDELPRRHARFISWRRTWGHALDIRQWPEDEAGSLPSLLLDDGPVFVQVLDRMRWRGRCEIDMRKNRLWREQIDALLQRSAPAMPVTQLGI